MSEFNYFIYDGADLIAGFVSLCTAVTFCEEWRHGDTFSANIPVDLVDAHTGEVVDTWQNNRWENGNH